MQLTKKLLEWFELHPKWFFPMFVVYTIFVAGSGWVMPYIRPDKVICNPQISCPNQGALGKGTSGDLSEPNCRTENFEASRWKTGDYRENAQGYWCPKNVWEDPVMWYSDGVRPGFSSIYIEYETMKDVNISTSNPPSFITAYGKETPILKSWTTEGENFQLFRFAKNLDLSRKILTPNLAEGLPDPVKLYQKDSFAIIQNKVLEGGEILLDFVYKYTSNLTGEAKQKTFPETVRMPGSDPSTTSTKYPFGIGTFVGNCIKPALIKICE